MRSAVVGSGKGRGIRGATALILVAVAFAGCRSQRVVQPGTEVGVCDTMQGRLPVGRCSQSFTFEGVESSLLEFTLRADRGDLAAPKVTLTDPEGQPVALAAHTVTPQGAATMRVSGVVLRTSGPYQVTVAPAVPCEEVFYQFTYTLSFPPIQDMRVNLTSCQNVPITISAPRGGQVTVQITPLRGACTRAQFNGVEDPWGGRALDPTRRLPGAPPAKVHHGDDGSLYLNFNAPVPGRYTVLAGARPGYEGPALLRAQVRSMGGQGRLVVHPNRAPEAYGMAGGVISGSASDR